MGKTKVNGIKMDISKQSKVRKKEFGLVEGLKRLAGGHMRIFGKKGDRNDVKSVNDMAADDGTGDGTNGSNSFKKFVALKRNLVMPGSGGSKPSPLEISIQQGLE